jgi:hypothetical protein
MSTNLSNVTAISISSNSSVSGLKYTVFGIPPGGGDVLIGSGDVVNNGLAFVTGMGFDQYYVVLRSGEEGCRIESKALSTGGSADVVLSITASTPTG